MGTGVYIVSIIIHKVKTKMRIGLLNLSFLNAVTTSLIDFSLIGKYFEASEPAGYKVRRIILCLPICGVTEKPIKNIIKKTNATSPPRDEIQKSNAIKREEINI